MLRKRRRRKQSVSVLFSEPKISQSRYSRDVIDNHTVSVLFSEPKISQSERDRRPALGDGGFSALQRAENFSIAAMWYSVRQLRAFQCSSASRKFLNSEVGHDHSTAARVSVLFSEPKISQFGTRVAGPLSRSCFSALQRAENFSITRKMIWLDVTFSFSALQRAENFSIVTVNSKLTQISFSALQRAENFSI